MKRITTVARIALGLGFTLFALNYFVPFLPAPKALPPPAAMTFIGSFMSSGFLTLVKVIELSVGIALIANLFVPLALTLLAPIMVGILSFHILLAPGNFPVVLTLLALHVGLAYAYRSSFLPMLKMRAVPAPIAVAAKRPQLVTEAG
jgi:hypothetical protein